MLNTIKSRNARQARKEKELERSNVKINTNDQSSDEIEREDHNSGFSMIEIEKYLIVNRESTLMDTDLKMVCIKNKFLC